MNCRKARKWISLDLDGELPEENRQRLAAHLETCEDCRALKRTWSVLGERLRIREIPVVQTPEAAWADVRRAIRTQGDAGGKDRETRGLRWAWAAALAAVLVIGAGTWYALYEPGEPVSAEGKAPASPVEWVETSLPGAMPMVYEDAETGLVVIWVVEANGEEKEHADS